MGHLTISQKLQSQKKQLHDNTITAYYLAPITSLDDDWTCLHERGLGNTNFDVSFHPALNKPCPQGLHLETAL